MKIENFDELHNETKICTQMWNSVTVGVNGKSNLCCNMVLSEEELNQIDDNIQSSRVNTFLQSTAAEKIRSQMLNNIAPKECKLCFNKENEIGKFSSIRFYKNQCFFAANKEFNSKVVSLQNVEIQLGNLCQLRCVMCSSTRSIKIQDFEISLFAKNGILKKRNEVFNWHEDYSLIDKIVEDSNNVIEYFINGGEPLLAKTHNYFLNKLIETGRASEIRLKYATNGLLINDEHLNLWKRFKSIELVLSIDDIFDRYHIIRFPGSFDQLEEKLIFLSKNQELFQKDGSIISIYVVVNILNFLYLPEFLKYFFEKFPFIQINISCIQQPDHLNPINLPKHLKQSVFDKILNIIPLATKYTNSKMEVESILNKIDNPKKLLEGIEFFKNFADYYHLDLFKAFPLLENIDKK